MGSYILSFSTVQPFGKQYGIFSKNKKKNKRIASSSNPTAGNISKGHEFIVLKRYLYVPNYCSTNIWHQLTCPPADYRIRKRSHVYTYIYICVCTKSWKGENPFICTMHGAIWHYVKWSKARTGKWMLHDLSLEWQLPGVGDGRRWAEWSEAHQKSCYT